MTRFFITWGLIALILAVATLTAKAIVLLALPLAVLAYLKLKRS